MRTRVLPHDARNIISKAEKSAYHFHQTPFLQGAQKRCHLAGAPILFQVLKIIDELEEDAEPEECLDLPGIEPFPRQERIHQNRRPPFFHRGGKKLRRLSTPTLPAEHDSLPLGPVDSSHALKELGILCPRTLVLDHEEQPGNLCG